MATSRAADEAAIRCTGLRKTYGAGETAVQALRGVDLDVRSGELLVIVGPSGCGKTTLVSIIAGLLDSDDGSCEVLGRHPQEMDRAARAAFRRDAMGFVFQAFNLLPGLSAVENVSIPLLLAGVHRDDAEARSRETLVRVGLEKRAEARPAELSGGQQQRVAIARAIVHEPRLVLCDEPTSNLDHATGVEMMRLLQSAAHGAGRTLVIVTHDPRIYEFGDRIAHMDDGRVVGFGMPADRTGS